MERKEGKSEVIWWRELGQMGIMCTATDKASPHVES